MRIGVDRKKNAPATPRLLAPLKHADHVKGLLLRKGVDGDGAGGPSADDGHALDRAHGAVL